MKVLGILLIVLVVLAVLYFLMIMPRMLHKPDTAPFKEWLYATEVCMTMPQRLRRTPWQHFVRLWMQASVLNWIFS